LTQAPADARFSIWAAPNVHCILSCAGLRQSIGRAGFLSTHKTGCTWLKTVLDRKVACRRWIANLRVLDIGEIKAVPYVPGPACVGRTADRHDPARGPRSVFFWNALALTRELEKFLRHSNHRRVQRSPGGTTPAQRAGAKAPAPAKLEHHGWQQYRRCLFQIPVAA
jgi:hypothetical protein